MRPTIENAKKQQEYIDSLKQQFGEMTPVDESLREKSVNIATNVIGALPFGGGGDYYDRKIAKNLFGDYYADNIADSIGVLDFTPLGLVYAVDEALREYGQAEKATDYILPTVGLGLSALEALPLTEIGTRPLRRFLSNLANKTSAPTDTSRRTLLQGAVAAPVAAGALSQIPLGKVVDEVVPVAKETAPVLKKSENVESILKFTNIPKIKNTIKEADINELNRIISNEHDKYGGLYEKSKLPEGMDYMKFKKMLINLSERFDFKNTNLKKPRKFDSLTDVNKQKIYDMSLDESVDQDELQDIVDELRDEEKFFGAR